MKDNFMLRKWQEIHRELAHLEQCAGIAENAETKEPLYYYMLNEIEFIRQATTPWWVKFGRMIGAVWHSLLLRIGLRNIDDFTPF